MSKDEACVILIFEQFWCLNFKNADSRVGLWLNKIVKSILISIWLYANPFQQKNVPASITTQTQARCMWKAIDLEIKRHSERK